MNVWHYSVEREVWSMKESRKLRTEGALTAAVLVPNQQCVVWCEREKDGGLSCSVRQQNLYGSEGVKETGAMYVHALYREPVLVSMVHSRSMAVSGHWIT